MTYAVLILGREDFLTSGGLVNYAICDEFNQLDDVRIYHMDWRKKSVDYPKADFVVYIGPTDQWNLIDKDLLRKTTGCIKLVTVLEQGFVGADWCYVFKQSKAKNVTCMRAPLHRPLYKNIKKVKGTILVDHPWRAWIGTSKDQFERTDEILNWMKPYQEEFKVTRITRTGDDISKHPYVQDYINTINFKDYLFKTNRFETFVVTHREGFGYSVLDMIARGIRVIAPKGFLNKTSLIDAFWIKEFSTKEEFFKLLREPVDEVLLSNLPNKCGSYGDIVAAMDLDFRGWIGDNK